MLNGLYGPRGPTKWTSPLGYSIELNGPFPQRLDHVRLAGHVELEVSGLPGLYHRVLVMFDHNKVFLNDRL